jgi:radical SAM protein with 4Fe4S-binding SPASM domain
MIRYTELKNSNRQDLMRVLPLAKPFTLLIEPSSLCNFRCIHCFQSLKQKSYFSENRLHMPLPRCRKIIEQMQDWPGARLKVLKLSLYGEPLLNPDFCEMLKIAKEADIAERIETTSNASLLDEDTAEKIMQYQLDYIRVSIYSAIDSRQREITGSNIEPGFIRQNLKALQALKRRAGSARPFVSVKMLDSFDEEQNKAFFAMYGDVADELYLDKPHNWIQTGAESFTEKIYRENHDKALSDFQANCSARIACPMPFTSMAVRSNGQVSPCCVDFIGGTNLGNMEEKSLRDIWNSREWLQFQIMQLEDRKEENYSCAHCDIYKNDYYTRDNIDAFPVEKLRRPE